MMLASTFSRFWKSVARHARAVWSWKSPRRGPGAYPQSLALALVLGLQPAHAGAQAPYLVKDLTRAPWVFNGTSTLRSSNGIVYIVAEDVAVGQELFRTDFTGAGLLLVHDIYSGSGGSGPTDMTDVNGTLFFVAQDNLNGRELWRSDGTAGGTMLVKDIAPGSGSSLSGNLTNVNGTLYFTANDGVAGEELWKSDGTASGTVLVKDISMGINGSSPTELENANGTLYFSASGAGGRELWRSDGTAAGTVLVKDISPASSNPGLLTSVNGVLYFVADNGTVGRELWKSDGTAIGTVLVKDIRSGVAGSSCGFLTNMNGTLFFSADDGTTGAELWKSDGTAIGTVLVKDIAPGSSSGPASLAGMNGTLYFSAADSTNGRELWKSDGTAAGTVAVTNVAGSLAPTQLTPANGTLYFTVLHLPINAELWKSDGTQAGTTLIRTFQGPGGLLSLTALADSVYFGWITEVWKSDGTTAGTMGLGRPTLNSYPHFFTKVNGTVFFVATDGVSGPELWKTDGTSAGTMMVRNIAPTGSSYSPNWLTSGNGVLYFTMNDGVSGEELWRSDGTLAGTVMVKDIRPGSATSSPSSLTNVNGTIYFEATDGTTGFELWKSDGTTAGTVLVKDIWPGVESSSPRDLVAVNGTLYFTASNGVSGLELWKSDGTAAGTVLVKDLIAGASDPQWLTNVNGMLFFTAEATGGRELWKSNGTAGGTVLVKDISPVGSSTPAFLTSANGLLYFAADDGVNGRELWKSDGTPAGTVLVQDLAPGSSFPTNLTNVNGILYFAVKPASWEVWKSDGSAAGTVLVSGLSGFGEPGTEPGLWMPTSGGLYFQAHDGTGYELWKTDGTTPGTAAVGLRMAGGLLGIGYACGYLLAAGTTPATGSELFAVSVNPAPAYADLDGDGYGSGPPIVACAENPGYSINDTDCDDTDPTVHPGVPETLCNGIDNNCSGTIDEGVACVCTENGPGLAGWWRAEGTPNDGAAGNHGILVDNVTYAPGRVGQAFLLDGAGSHVANLGDTWSYAFVENTGIFTILAWIHLSDLTAPGLQSIVASAISPSDWGFNFLWRNNSGEQRLELDLMRGDPANPVIASTSPSQVITTGGWHHVAAVGDGTTVTFYVDGASFAGTGTMGNKPQAAATRAVSLGTCAGGLCPFNGRIDEVQIYDRALSGNEIGTIFNTNEDGIAMCGTGCVQTPQGLVGWWPGSGDAADRSLFNNHGGFFDGEFTGGKVGRAFSFVGTNYVDITDHPSLEVTTQLTLAAWVRPGQTALNNSARILSKWATGSSAYELLVDSSNDLRLRADISNDGVNYDALVAPSSMSVGQWVHAATTFQSGVWRLFVNGTMVASKVSPVTSIFAGGTSNLSIGRLPGNLSPPSHFFYGAIDEPVVYNRALTDTEIRSLYTAGASGQCGLGIVNAVEETEDVSVLAFSLAKPWPNPADRASRIAFRTPAAGAVRAEVYDVAGRKVATLLRGERLPAGEHHLIWECRDDEGRRAAAGIYFVRVAAGSALAVRKIAVIKR